MTVKPTTTEAPPAVSRQVAIEQMSAAFIRGYLHDQRSITRR